MGFLLRLTRLDGLLEKALERSLVESSLESSLSLPLLESEKKFPAPTGPEEGPSKEGSLAKSLPSPKSPLTSLAILYQQRHYMTNLPRTIHRLPFQPQDSQKNHQYRWFLHSNPKVMPAE